MSVYLEIVLVKSNFDLRHSEAGDNMLSPYAHFLSGAKPQLETVDCLYAVRCSITSSVSDILEIGESIFNLIDRRINRIEIANNNLKTIRGNISKFRQQGAYNIGYSIDDLLAISLSSWEKDDSALEKTWNPHTYAVVHRYGRTWNFGFYTKFIAENVFSEFMRLSASWNALSVGRFPFPVAMSPKGYMAAVSVFPAERERWDGAFRKIRKDLQISARTALKGRPPKERRSVKFIQRTF